MIVLTDVQKAEWIIALRGGEYVQGLRQFRVYDSGICLHCAFGVLADIHPQMTFKGGGTLIDVEFESGTEADDDAWSDLICKIADDNDGGMSFNEIAVHLEQGKYDHLIPTGD